MPQSAKNDISLYIANGVFKHATEGVDKYCCNITLTRRPQAKEERFQTKADKNLHKHKETDLKESAKKDIKANNDQSNAPEERVLFRLTIDMRQINLATMNDTTLVLPSIQTIERSFNDAIVSCFDLSNMFYNIALQPSSQKYFNFYIEDSMLGHVRLPQG